MRLNIDAMAIRNKLIGLSAVLVLTGCNPRQFMMGSNHVIDGEIMTSLGGVDAGRHVTTVRDTGAVDLSYFGATQYLFTATTKLTEGEGFRLMVRPVVEHRVVKDSGLVITATRAGVRIDSNGRTLAFHPEAKLVTNGLLPISLLTENNYTQVVFGCDTVYHGWTPKKESDDIVVQALEHSAVQIIEPDWAAPPDIPMLY